MKMPDFSKYVEPQVIGKRFLITLIILYAWLTTDHVSNEVLYILLSFYFGSHKSVSDKVNSTFEKIESKI